MQHRWETDFGPALDNLLDQAGEEGQKIKALINTAVTTKIERKAKKISLAGLAAGVTAAGVSIGSLGMAIREATNTGRYEVAAAAAQQERNELRAKNAPIQALHEDEKGSKPLDKPIDEEVLAAREHFVNKWLPMLDAPTQQKFQEFVKDSKRDLELEKTIKAGTAEAEAPYVYFALAVATALTAGMVSKITTPQDGPMEAEKIRQKGKLAKECLNEMRNLLGITHALDNAPDGFRGMP